MLAAFLIMNSIACKRNQPFRGYDGKWWEKTPADQQLGFVDGYLDHLTADLRRGSGWPKPHSWYQSAISQHYSRLGSDTSELVGQVLSRLTEAKLSSLPANAGRSGEPGPLDGRAWNTYSEKRRMGFVEGYLNALMPRTSRARVFPRSPEQYANAVTRWYAAYNLDEATDDRTKKRIGEVLWNLRNSSAAVRP